MFSAIMVPVDLTHADRLDKALSVAADMAQRYDATLTYVGVTAATPGPVAHNPKEFAEKLDAFAMAQAASRGVRAKSHAVTAHDPAADLDDALLKASKDTGADLVVMASHIPGVMDAIWPAHGGALAAHAGVSVLLVR